MPTNWLQLLSVRGTRMLTASVSIPRGTRGQNRPLVSFWDILETPLVLRMRGTEIFRERVATFYLKNMSFLAELQPY